MSQYNLIEGVYSQLKDDEVLLRYLHYVPKNQLDNPLDENKPNILELPIKEQFKIVDNTIRFMDKKFLLDLDSQFGRVNVYLGERKPYTSYSSGARRLVNNPFVSRQELIVDILIPLDTNRIDMRLFKVIERISCLLNYNNYKQFLGLRHDFGYTISNTPDNYVGYKLIYYTLSPQESTGGIY